MALSLGAQLVWLFVLALSVACIAWTLTHEEVFREPREYCAARSQNCGRFIQRKFFYIFTCEYCISHYITAAILFITRYHLLFPDWRGYLIAGFSLVWIGNFYMGVFGHLRLEIKSERIVAAKEERELAKESEFAHE